MEEGSRAARRQEGEKAFETFDESLIDISHLAKLVSVCVCVPFV